jgi:pyruvate/2-oxoglutarate/acetoin dehydrogenase E1 component
MTTTEVTPEAAEGREPRRERRNRPKRVTYLEAIAAAQRQEMQRDPSVFMMGLDIQANVFGTTGGFLEEFGAERIRNVPLSEAGFAGAAAGAAMTGLRPIVDFNISSFMYVAMDQLVSQVAKARYVFGGQATVPVVYRSAMFYHGGNAAQHSDRPYPMFMNVPGLKIIVPSGPLEAKGLLTAAIRDDNPVLCFEDATLWGSRGEVPDGEVVLPIGRAAVLREGSDATVVAIAGSVQHALNAAEQLAADGISVEVIDPRSLVPLDRQTILESVAKTGHLVIVDPAHQTCGAAAEIAACVAEDGFASLRAAIARVTTPDTHPPFSPSIEAPLYPTVDRVLAAVRRVVGDAPQAADA